MGQAAVCGVSWAEELLGRGSWCLTSYPVHSQAGCFISWCHQRPSEQTHRFYFLTLPWLLLPFPDLLSDRWDESRHEQFPSSEGLVFLQSLICSGYQAESRVNRVTIQTQRMHLMVTLTENHQHFPHLCLWNVWFHAEHSFTDALSCILCVNPDSFHI